MSAGKNTKVDTKRKLAVNKYDEDELIFALDIGTRTVIGIVGIQEGDKFKALATEIIEHKNRAMLDGQIHDISLVADIVSEVKERLEKKLSVKLNKVAIAAAGRVLKTYSVKVERTYDSNKEVTKEVIGSLELEGVQNAQSELESEQKNEEKTIFYCVGYSVISYYLNGYVISSLLGHKGKSIGVEVIATFLPHVVVDSLYTVMNRVGLEVINLTLEPIAAINVCIPQNLRLLNLALVDVGAGTSDIAITRDGAVIGYSMAPIAGDEITEKIAHNYLVDFNTAEKIKLSLGDESQNIVTFSDVLGNIQKIEKKEIYKIINDSVILLGETIAQRILEYNKKAPNAVFCVGGGSQIKGLTEIIANRLGLPLERVAVRGRDIIQSVKFSGKKLSGPEAITPLGIAVTAMQSKYADFLSVTLNNKKIRLFNSKKLSVADSLILDGFDPKHLIGRTGKSITFELNGEKKVVRGEHGKPAVITVNGEVGNMETGLKPGDVVEVKPAVDGTPAKAVIQDFVDAQIKKISYDRNMVDIVPTILINGHSADSQSAIHDGDKVTVAEIKTIGDFSMAVDINLDKFSPVVNGVEVDKDYILKENDAVEFSSKSAPVSKQEITNVGLFDYERDYAQKDNAAYINEPLSKQDIVVDSMDSDEGEIYTKSGRAIKVSVNGKSVTIDGNKNEYVFIDVFNSYEIDTSKIKSGTVALKLNGRPANYTDIIQNGDDIEICWENN